MVSRELTDFATAVRDVPELRTVLKNPELDPATKAGVVADLIGDAAEHLRNIQHIAAEKGRKG